MGSGDQSLIPISTRSGWHTANSSHIHIHHTAPMKTLFHPALTAAFGFLALCLTAAGPLPGAELATDFPKPPIPLELAPRMGRPFNDNAVFQQQMPIPVWGWTLPGADVRVSLDQQKRIRQSRGGRPLRGEVRCHARRQAEVGERRASRPQSNSHNPLRRQGGDEDVFQHPDR